MTTPSSPPLTRTPPPPLTRTSPPLTVTVIIPAHNEEAGLPATLRSVKSQSVPPDKIIVVDDGSTDHTGDVAASYGVTVLRRPATWAARPRPRTTRSPTATRT